MPDDNINGDDNWLQSGQIEAQLNDIEGKLKTVSDPAQKKELEDKRDELLRALGKLQENN